jgi:type II secretory pathway predicted ATPase ExeA
MYESFFGLRKRPFAAAPDAEVMVETPAVADAVARLDRCVRNGRGVAVMTAAAGMGKTQLCHHFVRRFGGEFRVAMLPNASFPTRRGFLQAILAELDQPYQKLGETELRLELTSVAKAALAHSSGVVLILDEAHRYSERTLDEVRLVANLIENGEPLMRVILSGHTELEDKLADPGLSGLNERVGELVSLPKLTAEESRTYLRERTAFAGGSLEGLFDEASLALVVRACGGIPRCLNQLADHSLLRGYVAERRPIDESLVREALDDLKRLPMQWHDPLPESAATFSQRTASTARSSVFEAGRSDDVIEIGGLIDEDAASDESPGFEHDSTPRIMPARPQPEPVVSRSNEPSLGVEPRPAQETVQDRFARIDAAEARRQWFETLECSPSAASAVETIALGSIKVEALDRGTADDELFPSELFGEESSREESSHEESSAAEISDAAPPVAMLETPPRPAGNPLETLDRIVPLLTELETEFGGEPFARSRVSRRIDGGVAKVAEARVELERLVASLESHAVRSEPAVNAPGPTVPPEAANKAHPRNGTRSTLFSDLRRRQNGATND